MNRALAIPSSSSASIDTKWTVMNGHIRGTGRWMSLSEFTIGRSTECEFVVIQDAKCSRRHVLIHCSPQGCELVSLSEDNPALVNGKPVMRYWLSDNDLVTVGQTDI